MAIFNFGKQKMHTQMYGHTSGREMFKVDEYQQVKKLTGLLGFIMVALFTAFYFLWDKIPLKIKIFMSLVFIGCGIWEYFNAKNMIRIRELLY